MAETKSKKASNAQSDEKPTAIIAYKGFDKDLRCRGFQFEVGKTYTVDGEIVACSNGFHACTNPLDVWNYYPIINDDGELNRFAVVTQGGALSRNNDADSKVASASITIDIELSLPAFIKHTIDFVVDLTKSDASSGDYATNASSGDYAKNASSGYNAKNASSGYNATNASSGYNATNASSGDNATNASSGYNATNASSGDYATNASSGDNAKNASSGNYAKNASSGDYAKNASSGDYAKNASSGDNATNASSGYNATNASSGNYATNASSGYNATNASSGDYATNASSGDNAKNASSGNYAKNASSGNYGRNSASGANSVIMSAGVGTLNKGPVGTWIGAAEYDDSGNCIGIVRGCVGQDGIEPDTWYIARGGKLAKVEG